MEQRELYNRLCGHLDEELKVYRHLLDVVRKEKEILISANIDDLNENNKAKEAMLVKLRQLDRIREKSARDLALAIGADPERPRLLELANRLQGDQKARLQSLHTTFDLIVKRVKELNQSNEGLVQSALQNVQGVMQALRTTLQESPTYKKQGDLAKGEVQSGQIVSREA